MRRPWSAPPLTWSHNTDAPSPPRGSATRWRIGARTPALRARTRMACARPPPLEWRSAEPAPHTLMATFGWLDIKQAERYTREAEPKRLTRENAHLLGTNQDEKSLTLEASPPPVREKVEKRRG